MLPELQAEQQLHAIEAAAGPHMKADDFRKTIEKYTTSAGQQFRPPRATIADLERLGIPIRKVKKKTTKAVN